MSKFSSIKNNIYTVNLSKNDYVLSVILSFPVFGEGFQLLIRLHSLFTSQNPHSSQDTGKI